MTNDCSEKCCACGKSGDCVCNDILICSECGKDCTCPVVEVIVCGSGEISCCGKPMAKIEEKTADFKTEKHVPVIEKIPGGYKVTVGSTLHPMIDTHWIVFIELTVDNKVYKEYLKPSMAPVATFLVEGKNVTAREYCNIHGLWKGGIN